MLAQAAVLILNDGGADGRRLGRRRRAVAMRDGPRGRSAARPVWGRGSRGARVRGPRAAWSAPTARGNARPVSCCWSGSAPGSTARLPSGAGRPGRRDRWRQASPRHRCCRPGTAGCRSRRRWRWHRFRSRPARRPRRQAPRRSPDRTRPATGSPPPTCRADAGCDRAAPARADRPRTRRATRRSPPADRAARRRCARTAW